MPESCDSAAALLHLLDARPPFEFQCSPALMAVAAKECTSMLIPTTPARGAFGK